jgi:hypothetical protein
MTWVLFLLSLSLVKIYQRYYVDPVFEDLILYCGAESVVDQKYLGTSIPNMLLENANTQSTEKSRSGDYSVKLDATNPYGFTYRSYNGSAGDVIKVTVWRLGESGSIVISGDGGKEFYLGSQDYSDIDSSGWKKLNLIYTLQEDMHGKEVGIYIFNNLEEPSYFDDLEIEVSRLQAVD